MWERATRAMNRLIGEGGLKERLQSVTITLHDLRGDKFATPEERAVVDELAAYWDRADRYDKAIDGLRPSELEEVAKLVFKLYATALRQRIKRQKLEPGEEPIDTF